MPRILPAHPNIEQLKHQARDLLKAYQSGDGDVQKRFRQELPAPALQSSVVLAHALLLIAREYSFESWPKLKQAVELILQQQSKAEQSTEREQRLQRRVAEQQRIAALAERVALAARDQNLEQLFAALWQPARDMDAMRAYLVEQGLYTSVVDALLVSVEHPSDPIRFSGAQAMDHYADQRCAGPLQTLLHDAVPRVRWAALHSLQCAQCKLTPLQPASDTTAIIIDMALHDPSIKVRRVASYELGQLCDDARVIATLKQLQQQETDATILRHVRHALRRSGE